MPVGKLGGNCVPSNSGRNRMFNSFYNKLSEISDSNIPIKQLPRRELKIKSKLCTQLQYKALLGTQM